MEVFLDLAENVVAGQVTAINTNIPGSHSGLIFGKATIAVSQTLKGPHTKTIEAKVVAAMIDYQGSATPHLRRVGDSGIWILSRDGSEYGLVSADKVKQVEQALKLLDKRAWTKQVNGLQAWAGAIYPQLDPDYDSSRPWLEMAVRNVSDHEIYYPLNSMEVTAVAEDGKTVPMNNFPDTRERAYCRKILPGETVYLSDFLSPFNCFQDAKDGTYTVSLKYENARDGETTGKPGYCVPVKAWKGFLTPAPFPFPIKK